MNNQTISVQFSHSLIQTILIRAREAGLRLFIVGGTVRDVLLGLSDFADIDMVYDGDFETFQRTLFKEIPFKRIAFDKKGFHTERFCFRKVTVDFQPITDGLLDIDARQRDFTVNALFLEFLENDTFSLIDHVGGRSDLETRRIRCVSDHAFMDDPLRILRMFRLAVTLGFHYTDDELNAARKYVAHLRPLARERVRSELEQIMPMLTTSIAIDMRNIGVDKELFGFSVNANATRQLSTLPGALFDLFYNHGKSDVLPEWGMSMTFGTRECTLWRILHDMMTFPDSSEELFFRQFHAVHLMYLKEIVQYFEQTSNQLTNRVQKIAQHHARRVDGIRIAQEFGVSGAALGALSNELHCIQIIHDEYDPDTILKLYREGLDF